MKKSTCILLFLFTCFYAFSIDWGVLLYNDTSLSANKLSKWNVKQTDYVDFSLSSVLNTKRSLYISFDGFYEFIFDKTETSVNDLKKNIKNVVDINELAFSYQTASGRGSAFFISVGRIFMEDLTGLVFSQSFDGLALKLSNMRADLAVFGGYTGFLNAHSTTMLVPIDTHYRESENAIYAFSPKYFPCGLSISFPTGREGQRLDLQVWGIIDANKDEYNRIYGMLGFSGYGGKYCFYDVKTVFGTENIKSVMNMTLATVKVFLPKAFEISVSGNYASGKNAVFSPFNGFTSKRDDLVYWAGEYSGLLKADLSVEKAFNRFFYGALSGGAVFDCSENVSYFGFFANVNSTLNVFDDLQFNLSVEQFVGKNKEMNKTHISLKAVFEL